ncbi:N-acetyltransferase ESCO2, partial [Striga asiatica]
LMRWIKWDVGVLGVLKRDGCLAEDKLQGNGVNYHLASVFLDELKGVGLLRKEVVDVVFGPFFTIVKSSFSYTVLARAERAVKAQCKDQIFLLEVKSCLYDDLIIIGGEEGCNGVLTKKKIKMKRNYAQLHLEVGQPNFLWGTCNTCGFKYAPRGWSSKRIIDSHGKGCIIMVQEGDPPSQQNKVREVMQMMEMELGEGWIME